MNYYNNMSSDLIAEIKVFVGSNNLYYSAFGDNYDIRVPIEFALIAKTNGGLCYDCYTHGFMNGVFVGFCARCIDEKYGFARGNGMLPGCIERSGWNSGRYYDPKFSVWKTYMISNQITDDDDADVGCIILADVHANFINALLEDNIPVLEQEQKQEQEQEQEHVAATSEVTSSNDCYNIEIQQISIHDRLQNSEMLCGNN